MRVYTADEMQVLDQSTFDRLGLPSCAIMENAGRQVVEVLLDRFGEEAAGSIVVLCGPGNNGGDGFVVARVLKDLGYGVSVISLKNVAQLSGDAQLMAQAWHEVGGDELVLSDSTELDPEAEELLFGSTLIVDALFGTGFEGAPRGVAGLLIEFVAGLSVATVSIDLPSGVNATDGSVPGVCIHAWATVAIQCLKLGHLLFPAAEFAGSVVLVDVGIREEYQPADWPKRELLDIRLVNDLVQCYLPGSADGHKGSRGHLLVAGGASGRVGAVKLAGQAALRCGAGLVTLGVAEDVSKQLSPVLEELMCETLTADSNSVEALCRGKDAIVLGPGLGQSAEAAEALESLLNRISRLETPLVLDADALNLIAVSAVASAEFPNNSIMTPHPGEAARLLGVSVAEVQADRIQAVLALVEKFDCTVVLKGARTVIAHPSGAVFINPTADEALGTAGSGDVLSGVVGALLARRIPTLEAAIIAVFAHGLAGEYLSVFKGRGSSFLAGELAQSCGALLQRLAVFEIGLSARRDIVLPSWIPHIIEFEDWAD